MVIIILLMLFYYKPDRNEIFGRIFVQNIGECNIVQIEIRIDR